MNWSHVQASRPWPHARYAYRVGERRNPFPHVPSWKIFLPFEAGGQLSDFCLQSSATVLVKLVATSATRSEEPVSRLENFFLTPVLIWTLVQQLFYETPNRLKPFDSLSVLLREGTRFVFVRLVFRGLLSERLDL